MESAGPSVFIPVVGGETIVIPYGAMPMEEDDMIEILAAESADLDVWVQVAKAYLAQVRLLLHLHGCHAFQYHHSSIASNMACYSCRENSPRDWPSWKRL